MKRWLCALFPVVVLLAGTASPAAAIGPVRAAEDDILTRLRAVPGLAVVAEHGAPAEYRLFALRFRQSVDHRQPSAGTFEQRLTLLHRTTAAPMVLHTSGYDLYYDRPFRPELTRLLDANQIAVEQRFFTPSRPEPVDWTRLTVWQAATDHHRIVAAFEAIYGAKWISTGESKGGMDSVYHRRFYPSDVDGTVAYVAPNDVDDADDVYTQFFETVGTDPGCRTKLKDLQRDLLRRRAELVASYADWATANKRTFTILGTPDRAYELLVLEVPWIFWMRSSQWQCRWLPSGTAPAEELYRYLDRLAGFDTYTDQGIDGYVPFYYQAGTQTGYPTVEFPHLAGLLRYGNLFRARSFVPAEIPMSYDPTAMPDIDAWVRDAGSQLLFVYGQDDPWAAEPFQLGPGTRDSLWYQVPGGNHGVDIADLSAGQRDEAYAAVRRWAGVPAKAGPGRFIPDLDDWRPPRGRAPVRMNAPYMPS